MAVNKFLNGFVFCIDHLKQVNSNKLNLVGVKYRSRLNHLADLELYIQCMDDRFNDLDFANQVFMRQPVGVQSIEHAIGDGKGYRGQVVEIEQRMDGTCIYIILSIRSHHNDLNQSVRTQMFPKQSLKHFIRNLLNTEQLELIVQGRIPNKSQLIQQYQVTDWQLLQQVAKCFNLSVVDDLSFDLNDRQSHWIQNCHLNHQAVDWTGIQDQMHIQYEQRYHSSEFYLHSSVDKSLSSEQLKLNTENKHLVKTSWHHHIQALNDQLDASIYQNALLQQSDVQSMVIEVPFLMAAQVGGLYALKNTLNQLEQYVLIEFEFSQGNILTDAQSFFCRLRLMPLKLFKQIGFYADIQVTKPTGYDLVRVQPGVSEPEKDFVNTAYMYSKDASMKSKLIRAHAACQRGFFSNPNPNAIALVQSLNEDINNHCILGFVPAKAGKWHESQGMQPHQSQFEYQLKNNSDKQHRLSVDEDDTNAKLDIQIAGQLNQRIQQDEMVQVEGNGRIQYHDGLNVEVVSNQLTQIEGVSTNQASTYQLTVDEDMQIEAKQMHQEAESTMSIHSAKYLIASSTKKVRLQSGDSLIEMTDSGIQIKSADIYLNSMGADLSVMMDEVFD